MGARQRSRFLVLTKRSAASGDENVENTEDNSQVELSLKEHDIPNLSDYAKNLEKNVKSRYLEKISLVRSIQLR